MRLANRKGSVIEEPHARRTRYEVHFVHFEYAPALGPAILPATPMFQDGWFREVKIRGTVMDQNR